MGQKKKIKIEHWKSQSADWTGAVWGYKRNKKKTIRSVLKL